MNRTGRPPLYPVASAHAVEAKSRPPCGLQDGLAGVEGEGDLVVGALIKWESRGPVIFKQRRSGYWGWKSVPTSPRYPRRGGGPRRGR